MTIEFVVIAGYLVLLIAVGVAFRRFNSGVSDYFRLGGQGAWWMVGCSAFMTAFSAWTFTGAAGAAYEAGWSIQVIYLANVLAFMVHAALLSPWFRQLRAITAPEVIRMRFGASTQQIYAWLYAVLGLIYAAIWLWSLSTFLATVFAEQVEAPARALGLEGVQFVILVTGIVVLLYSTAGGSWAVMATDVLQSVILIPLTIVVAALSLREVGGVSGMYRVMGEMGLTETFQVVNEPGTYEPDESKGDFWKYTGLFAIAALIYKVAVFSTIDVAQKYFGVKNGKEARLASLLAGAMILAGMAFWFIPPIVSRLLFFEDVEALTGLTKPAEGAYAVAALRVLPAGLVGLMVVAMLSATMSSMDSGLNKNAGIFVRDIVPFVGRLFNLKEPSEKASYVIAQVASGVLGVVIIVMAMYFAAKDGKGVFEAMLNVGAMLALPLAIPLAIALFVRKAPWWSALVSVGGGVVPSAIAFGAGDGWWVGMLGEAAENAPAFLVSEWPYHWKVFVNLGVGAACFFATMPFWGTATQSYRDRVDEFFRRMHTPISDDEHVGPPRGQSQLRVVGTFALIISGSIGLLVLVPGNDLAGRLAILFVSAFIGTIGGIMVYYGYRALKQDKASAPD